MKQILPSLKEINKHLSFTKNCFTKNGFRHVQNYISGLITINKKTVRQISKAAINENHHSGINRLLNEAKFKQEELEIRYLKKIKYLTKGMRLFLLMDDSSVIREGKRVEEAQSHKDHLTNGYINGHQFFTSMIYTPALQLPLFPRLYSQNSISKIDMAEELIVKTIDSLNLYCVLFDSWYSDKKLIKYCVANNVKVICGVKTNRNISLKRGEWKNLGDFSRSQKFENEIEHLIDEHKYKAKEFNAKLTKIPHLKLLVSLEYDYKHQKWNKPFHLISTNKNDTIIEIIREYTLRWFIETYHRDIKQNLGFGKVFMRKKEAIVRHSVLVSLAYTILKLFMFLRGLNMTIGECCAYIQSKEMDKFLQEIVEIDDKKERLKTFEELFIRKTAKV